MAGINLKRWMLGGVAAGIVMWLLEGFASMIYLADMQAALEEHSLSIEMSPAVFVTSVAVSLASGLTMVFLYAAARPRFGPGPKTAVIAALALWIGGYALSLVGYRMMGLFPDGMLVTWGAIGLAEMVIAALAGGWIYRE